jgi:hypothetical protein
MKASFAPCAGLLLVLHAFWGTPARADGDEAVGGGPREGATTRSAATGVFLPFTSAATRNGPAATAVGFGGHDGTRSSGIFEAVGEVAIVAGLSLRGGAVYSGDRNTLRPSFGARYQLLGKGRHGVDGTVGVQYRPEGLTEMEGEVEVVVAVGAHLGTTYLAGNLIYGQDPEGNERDGEVRLAAVRPVSSRLFLGLDGRLRFDLRSQATPAGTQRGEARLDAVAGPVAVAVVGPVALMLQAGAAALRIATTTSYGALVLAGLGAAF